MRIPRIEADLALTILGWALIAVIVVYNLVFAQFSHTP